MNRKKLLSVILMIFLIGCSNIRYSPNTANTNPTEAKEIVKEVVQEQPNELAPIKVEVTDQYFKMYATKTNAMDGYIIPWNIVVYFNNIGKIEIKQKRRWSKKWFVIAVRDKNKNLRYTIYTAQESKVKSFIDALYTLKTIKLDENAMKYNL